MNPSKNRHWKGDAGFTLLELMAVVGIVVVLAALIFPTIGSMKETGQRSACLAHMRQVAGIVLQYSADNGSRVLPAASGANAWMNDNVWYELLDGEDYLIANATKPNTWSGKRNGIMSCPARDSAAFSYSAAGKHDLHYSLNQHPGFFNRVNTSEGGWPTLAKIPNPSRAFLLAESSFPIGYPNGENLVYPHPRKGKPVTEGEGMNLVFFDGHAEYYKGRIPNLWGGDFGQIPYETIAPEDSFPWF
jgi:prepilin-type N-terminal cleavage/methylation domain-containing protein/prepilin-type processing-associated H-X9-DG protein